MITNLRDALDYIEDLQAMVANLTGQLDDLKLELTDRFEEGLDDGYERGMDEGYHEGYEAGYDVGYSECINTET